MTDEPAVVAEHLTKRFQAPAKRWPPWRRREAGEAVTAVDDVSLTIPRGSLFGLLGPNGAGKTTLVKVLATLLLPTSGRAEVAGFDVVEHPDEVRRRVGVVLGGERALYWRLTGWENLWFFSQLYNIPGAEARDRVEELLELVGLGARGEDRVENYSKGMKQRLHIARGLLHDPEVLLLDEPTIGLDPHGAREVRGLVRRLVEEEDRTVVLTTHYMYEADELSDQVGIIDRGDLVALDSPAALKARVGEGRVVLVEAANAPGDLEEHLARLPEVEATSATTQGGVTRVRLQAREDGDAVIGAAARVVGKLGADLRTVRVDEPSLEDAFVQLTGHGLRAEGDTRDA